MSEGISAEQEDSLIYRGRQVFSIEKIDRTLSAEKKKALEVDRIMKMEIKYRPYEEELMEG